jgi:ParB family chromosome partitioning protein
VTWLRKHNYSEFKFLIEVRDLTDEQAFRLSDIENRDRQDISDYERAVDYLAALDAYYGNHLSQMAERLDVTVDWLSRYLDVAKLPDEVVAVYPDITEIRIQHARDLKPLLKDAKMRKRVIARAQEITIEQGRAREEGRVLLDGTTVVRELKAVSRSKASKPNVLSTYTCEGTNKPMLEVSRRGRSGLIVRIIPESGASKGDLLNAFERALSEHIT